MMFLFNIGFMELGWVDFIDILLVSYLIYQVYKMIKGSVAYKIFIGLISIYFTYLVVKALGMELLSGLLGQFVGVGVLAGIILFQQELRKILLLVGKTSFFSGEGLLKAITGKEMERKTLNLNPIIEAIKTLSVSHCGCLIVFPRSTELKFYAETGDMIDANISKRLLIAIFHKTSPMHDGAVIVARGRIKSARCILPVSENQELPANLGLRHRAAMGLSEITDAIVAVVSEETGQISLAHDGILEHNLSPQELKDKISLLLTLKKEGLLDQILKPEEVIA